MRRNNAVETGLELTVTNPATGQYLYYAAAVPAWSHGDQVILEADTGSTGVGAFAHFTVLDPAIAGAAMTLTGAYDAAKTAAAPGAAMSLSGGASSALTAAVEAALLNDLDGQALLAAIGAKVQALFDQDVDVPVATLVAQIAAGILANPSNKLATNASGYVTATNGGSGAAQNYVFPLVSTVSSRVSPNRIDLYTDEQIPTVLDVVDSAGTPVDCTGKTCTLKLSSGATVPSLTPEVLGDSVPYRYRFTIPSGSVVAERVLKYSLRVNTTNEVLAYGVLTVSELP